MSGTGPLGYRPPANPKAAQQQQQQQSQYTNYLQSRPLQSANNAQRLPSQSLQQQQNQFLGQGQQAQQAQNRTAAGAGVGYPYGQSGLSTNGTANANNISLDLSDSSSFPALGSTASSTLPNSTTSASHLLSSYASQAETPSAQSSYNLTNGSANALTADDFPALGGNQEIQYQRAPSVGPGATSPSSMADQSHQQQQQAQHRQNLLGAMAQGPRSAFAATDAEKRAYALKSITGTHNAALTWSQYSGLPNNGTGGNGPGTAVSPVSASVTTGSSNLFPHSQTTTQPSPMRSPVDLQNHINHGQGQAFNGLQLAATSAPRAPIAPFGSVAAGALGSTPLSAGATAATPAQQVLTSPADRFGLLGLLQIIRTSNPSLSMVALGNDLASLGLDLGVTDGLASTFLTPFTDRQRQGLESIQPDFHLPACYQTVQVPSLPSEERLKGFSDELLFFIFYSQPRDQMQELAAQQLYKKNWRFHKELALWLTKPAGSEAVQKSATFERGTYIFFDPGSWEKVSKEFLLVYDALESRPQLVNAAAQAGQPQASKAAAAAAAAAASITSQQTTQNQAQGTYVL